MAALLRAEQVARAAQLQIAHRDAEARAELRKFANRVEALLRRFGEHLARPNREIGVGQPVRAADAPAHLIELTQPEVIRVVDNQRVRHRDIQAGFDDRRAQQHVKLLLAEIQHHVFQRMLAHLAVRNRDARLRHEL